MIPLSKSNHNHHSHYSTILFYGIHFYFITLFEVLFYLYYILPYEQQLMVGLFDFNSNKDQSFLDKYNITVDASDWYETANCKQDANRLDDANRPLFSYCFYYIGFIHLGMMSLFCYDMYIIRLKLQSNVINIKNAEITTIGLVPKTFSFSSVETLENGENNLDDDDAAIFLEMGPMSNGRPNENINKNTNELTKVEINTNTNEKKTHNYLFYYWNHSKFIAEIIRSIYFILFIGAFEYLFFTQIVNQFKIFDLKLILCHLLDKI